MTQERVTVSDYHGLAKNSLWVIVSNLSMAFILALTVLASRILGDSTFGQYTFLLAISTLLADLSVLGTTDYVGILAARQPDRTGELVANALGLRLPLGVLFVALCLAVTWFSMPETLLASLLISSDWLLRTVIHLLRGVFRARNRFQSDAQVATIERLAVLVCATVALFLGQSLIMFTVGFLLGRLIGLAACFRVYWQLGERIWIGFQYGLWRRILQGGYPIGIRGMLKGVSFRVDAIILGLLRASSEVGWYGAAYKFLEAGFFFQEAVGSSFQPAISRAYGRGSKRLVGDLYGRGYKILLIIGGLATAVCFAYPDQIVAFIFGSEYSNSADALRILVWAMLLVFGSMTSLMLLDAVDSGSRTVLPFAIAVVVNIVLNIILIPRIGFLGAAWTTLLTEALLTIALLRVSYRAGYAFPSVWLFGPLAACIAFAGVATMFSSSIFLGTVLGLGVYITVLVSLRVFDATDLGYGRLLALRITRKVGRI